MRWLGVGMVMGGRALTPSGRRIWSWCVRRPHATTVELPPPPPPMSQPKRARRGSGGRAAASSGGAVDEPALDVRPTASTSSLVVDDDDDFMERVAAARYHQLLEVDGEGGGEPEATAGASGGSCTSGSMTTASTAAEGGRCKGSDPSDEDADIEFVRSTSAEEASDGASGGGRGRGRGRGRGGRRGGARAPHGEVDEAEVARGAGRGRRRRRDADAGEGGETVGMGAAAEVAAVEDDGGMDAAVQALIAWAQAGDDGGGEARGGRGKPSPTRHSDAGGVAGLTSLPPSLRATMMRLEGVRSQWMEAYSQTLAKASQASQSKVDDLVKQRPDLAAARAAILEAAARDEATAVVAASGSGHGVDGGEGGDPCHAPFVYLLIRSAKETGLCDVLIKTGMTRSFAIVMRAYSEKCGVPLGLFTLQFDGYDLPIDATPASVGMEPSTSKSDCALVDAIQKR